MDTIGEIKDPEQAATYAAKKDAITNLLSLKRVSKELRFGKMDQKKRREIQNNEVYGVVGILEDLGIVYSIVRGRCKYRIFSVNREISSIIKRNVIDAAIDFVNKLQVRNDQHSHIPHAS